MITSTNKARTGGVPRIKIIRKPKTTGGGKADKGDLIDSGTGTTSISMEKVI